VKTAIIHPWFLTQGGAEKVVDVLAEIYPQADIYGLLVDPTMLSPTLKSRGVRASVLDSLPILSRRPRYLVPLYPWGVESLDLREYDLVITSVCGPAIMGCAIRQDAIQVCYCHTPCRAWWDLYTEHQLAYPALLRPLFVMSASYIRNWEFCAMQRVDHVISNSNYIAHRVRKYFRRESTVIYPPVTMSSTPLSPSTGDYYFTLSRLEKEKRIDVLIEACNALGRTLLIAGTGSDQERLKTIAGPTIEFLGYVPDETLAGLYANSRAFLFASLEDFGIAPVEAQAYGRPVIAYGHGGSLETVRVNDPQGRPDTGVFFRLQQVDSVIDALRHFEQTEDHFLPEAIQDHARRFAPEVFAEAIITYVDNATKEPPSLNTATVLCQRDVPKKE